MACMLCGAVCEPGCAFVVWSQWEGSFCAEHLFWAGGQTRTLASWEGCQLHTTLHLFKSHIFDAISGVSWGHGGRGRVGAGAGAGAVVWESWGAIHHEPWSTVAARPSSPLCVVGRLAGAISQSSGPIGWCVLMSQPAACMLWRGAGSMGREEE